MMHGVRSNGHASAVLGVPHALPPHMHEAVIELSQLQTKLADRGHGWAKKLLTEICDEADAAGKVLFLLVDPPDTMDRLRLKRFYGRFGFGDIQAEPLLMTRAPKFWLKE